MEKLPDDYFLDADDDLVDFWKSRVKIAFVKFISPIP